MEKIKVTVWHNAKQKGFEATAVTRGRPVFQNATLEDRAFSTRIFGRGATKDAALKALAKALKVKPTMLEEDSSAKCAYKKVRVHPSGWSRPDRAKKVAAAKGEGF